MASAWEAESEAAGLIYWTSRDIGPCSPNGEVEEREDGAQGPCPPGPSPKQAAQVFPIFAKAVSLCVSVCQPWHSTGDVHLQSPPQSRRLLGWAILEALIIIVIAASWALGLKQGCVLCTVRADLCSEEPQGNTGMIGSLTPQQSR